MGLTHVDPTPYLVGRALPSFEGAAHSVRVNVDGVVAIRNPRPEGTRGYAQLFRNGYFETVSALPYNAQGWATFGEPELRGEFYCFAAAPAQRV